jgi:hypothetical protein
LHILLSGSAFDFAFWPLTNSMPPQKMDRGDKTEKYAFKAVLMVIAGVGRSDGCRLKYQSPAFVQSFFLSRFLFWLQPLDFHR